MTGALLLLATGLAHALGAPWWVVGALAPAGLALGPGLPLARRLLPGGTGLEQLLAGAWLGLGTTWIAVGLVREAGLRGGAAQWGLLGFAAAATAGAWAWARRSPAPRPSPAWERLAATLVVGGVVAFAGLRAGDLQRSLDSHWYLDQATEPTQEPLDLRPGEGWATAEGRGWDEAGAWALVPATPTPTLATVDGARGTLRLLVQGPVGSSIAAQGATATVAQDMEVHPEEGAVPRYLERGMAGITVEVDLPPGGELPLAVDGEAVFLVPGTDAVWALDEDKSLRFTHYYQILNQQENLLWAREVREDRWFVWNQPPGWSPLLSATTLLAGDDLPSANLLFLWVLGLVGLASVRLAGTLAPEPPLALAAVPGALVAAHGLLMIEPGSTNFPDSLYAAAILSTAGAAFANRPGAFGWLGAATQSLRWPGTVVSLLVLGSAWAAERVSLRPHLVRLGALVAVGAAVAGGAVWAGEADDLLFILYFETFPEHWHDDYGAGSLLPRVPGFYLQWAAYSGGALVLAPVALALGRGPTRRRGVALLGAALAYSALLCTIDHHVTHYFLPLVALSGPALVAGGSGLRRPWPLVLAGVHLLGTGLLLWFGRVF